MKRLVLSCLFAAILLPACGGTDDSGPRPDPEGTATTTLASGTYYALYSGLAADGPYLVNTRTYTHVRVRLEFLPSSLTTFFEVDISPASLFTYGEYAVTGGTGGEAADMGPVNGLADVTTKPSSGYSGQTTVQKGHGYVVRYRESRDMTNAAVPYRYSRFYVENWLTNAVTGGITGAIVKVQGPF